MLAKQCQKRQFTPATRYHSLSQKGFRLEGWFDLITRYPVPFGKHVVTTKSVNSYRHNPACRQLPAAGMSAALMKELISLSSTAHDLHRSKACGDQHTVTHAQISLCEQLHTAVHTTLLACHFVGWQHTHNGKQDTPCGTHWGTPCPQHGSVMRIRYTPIAVPPPHNCQPAFKARPGPKSWTRPTPQHTTTTGG